MQLQLQNIQSDGVTRGLIVAACTVANLLILNMNVQFELYNNFFLSM